MSAGTPLTGPAEQYMSEVSSRLEDALRREQDAVARAGTLVADRFDGDGILYVFGSGHSHVFAEEAFYRAGGAVRICPVLKPDYMLHVSAQRSTQLERESGHAAEILDGYRLSPERDVMLVVSNSGKNALPVEVATAARERGLPVIAITSIAYANATPSAGPRLHEVADIVLDNGCPPGDALVELRHDLPRVGPSSSVVGLALLNAVIVDALARQVARGATPEIYLSAGMPGGSDHNRDLARRFAPRIPHI